ncbi:Exo70 subunit of the exocyst complex [Candida orthopsilosis Co 90-125]|uniref:Exo70 subunit of the exocyst complex n=1 Tax=Candida orthopsilosis (strain 90-125) TaxID=1136231 RepID=H8XAZ8_CANO9|nr:Exo70 subunit of the exocyst complex [Candida orthopsilosis Co 90-125]CCG25246.1 Exo70 subunit of the exocyst complex [Candida orthopsilosis Co 90-125]
MAYKVDVDEADVAVLNQNLVKSKALFESINQSLTKISKKSQAAHTTIKPVLGQVNKLTAAKKEVEGGLDLLSEVSQSVSQINNFENALNNNIEVIGLLKYVNTLKQSQELYSRIKPKFKQFKGILYNFQNVIERSELKVQNYIDTVLNLETNRMMDKKHEVKVIFEYFNQQGKDQHIVNKYVDKRGNKIIQNLKLVEHKLQPTKIDGPYEKGTKGYNPFTEAVDNVLKEEVLVLKQCSLPPGLISQISEYAIREYNQVMQSLATQLSTSLTANTDNYLILLEIIDNLLRVDYQLKHRYVVKSASFSKILDQFISIGSSIFPSCIRSIEAQFQHITQFNDSSTIGVSTKAITLARRMCEFKQPLLQLIQTRKPGDWISESPPLQYISVFNSIITNTTFDDKSPEFLLSSYFADIIDCVMINIEVGLKKPHGEHSMKKSTQGFILLRNLYISEQIINRSQELFHILGSNGQERINKLKNRFLKLFLEDWSYASYIIIERMTLIATQAGTGTSGASNPNTSIGTGGGQATNLSNKEREQVKELFKKFNDSFEEALANYRALEFGDSSLRSFLGNEVKKMILNAYFKLYDKYGNSDFTKNRSKYIKWDKLQFERLLNEKL